MQVYNALPHHQHPVAFPLPPQPLLIHQLHMVHHQPSLHQHYQCNPLPREQRWELVEVREEGERKYQGQANAVWQHSATPNPLTQAAVGPPVIAAHRHHPHHHSHFHHTNKEKEVEIGNGYGKMDMILYPHVSEFQDSSAAGWKAPELAISLIFQTRFLLIHFLN